MILRELFESNDTDFNLNKYRGTFGWIAPDGRVIYRQKPSEHYHYELVKYFNTSDKQALTNPMAHGWIKFYKQDDELILLTFAKLTDTMLKSIFAVSKEFADSFGVARFSFESTKAHASGNSLIEFRKNLRDAINPGAQDKQ